jgi:hypothetical protein
MKKILLLILILPIQVYASDILEDIEKKAAKLSSCSVKQPCEITIEKKELLFVVKVKKSAVITEYGVLKYKSGSTTYHEFDLKGNYLGARHTT